MRVHTSRFCFALGLAWALFPTWREVFGRRDYAVIVAVATGVWAATLMVSAIAVWRDASWPAKGANVFILCLAAGLSCFWLFTFYPGVMSHDAISHWGQAKANRYSPWHPPLLAMLMHVTQCCATTPSLFSFVEGVLFWASTFYLIRQIVENGRVFLLSCIAITLIPPLWLYSNATVSNTWACSFMLLSSAAIIKAMRHGHCRLPVAAVAALTIAAMFRREVVFLVLLLIGLDLFMFRSNRHWLRRMVWAVVLVGVVWIPGRIIDFSPRVIRTGDNPAGPGLLNQYVGTIVRARPTMSADEFAGEARSIDSEYGVGTLETLLDRYGCDSGDYIVWRRQKPPVLAKDVIRTGFAIGLVGHAAVHHPMAFLGHQLCYAAYLTQFTDLDYETWGMVKWDRNLMKVRQSRGTGFDSKLPSVWEWYGDLMTRMMAHPVLTLLFRHYAWLMLSVLVLIVGVLNRRSELIVPALFSLVYPVAFLVAGPSPLWRYLLPSYVFAWVGTLGLLGLLVTRVRGSSS